MKFTDVEWSRILSAHAGGQLKKGGGTWSIRTDVACIVQAAKVIPGSFLARLHDQAMTEWFDNNYCREWIPELLLAAVEKFEADRAGGK